MSENNSADNKQKRSPNVSLRSKDSDKNNSKEKVSQKQQKVNQLSQSMSKP